MTSAMDSFAVTSVVWLGAGMLGRGCLKVDRMVSVSRRNADRGYIDKLFVKIIQVRNHMYIQL